jgi:TonB family protein
LLARAAQKAFPSRDREGALFGNLCKLTLVFCGALLVSVARGEDWEFSTVFSSGFSMTGIAAQAAEKSLEANPNDLNLRARVLGRYTYLARLGSADARGSRLSHIAWLIAHTPESTLLHYIDVVLQPSDFAPPHEDRRAAILAAWQDQVRQHPNDVVILANAALSLGPVDSHSVSDLYSRLRQLDPANPEWALGLAAVNFATICEEAGDTPADINASPTVMRLLQSNDEIVVGMTGQLLYKHAWRAKTYEQMGLTLIGRARFLNPRNPYWQRDLTYLAPVRPVNATLQYLTTQQFFFMNFGAEDLRRGASLPPFPANSSRLTVEPAVQAAKLIDHPDPLTPGGPIPQVAPKVVFEAILGTDGHVTNVRPVSGHVAVMQNAIDAVRHWTYRPTLVNGVPVEVATQIEVAFRPVPGSISGVPGGVLGGIPGGVLGGLGVAVPPPPPPPPPKREPGGPVSLREAVTRESLVTAPRPVYPADAKQDRIQRSVVLRVIIRKDGTVEEPTVISGHALLRSAALDAVRKWTYKPILVGGEPVSVTTIVTVNFTLQ